MATALAYSANPTTRNLSNHNTSTLATTMTPEQCTEPFSESRCDNGREEIIYEKMEVMYVMRRVEIESMGDMESLPEGEWVEAPVGLHAKFVYSVAVRITN